MTPEPPSSPDGSPLPPRHRPNLGNLAKDTTETDLWAFDDPESQEEPSAEKPPAEPTVPAPRPIDKLKVRQFNEGSSPKGSGSKDRIQTNISKIRPKSSAGSSPPLSSKPSGDFDDLDHWEDTSPAPEPLAIPDENPPEPEKIIALPEAPAATPPAPPAEPQANDSEEFAPALPEKPIVESLHLKLNLTKLERIGLVALLAVLVVGAASVVIYSLGRLPTESARVKSTDFPIKGRQLSIASADTYWRAPVVDGKTPDVIRRGTVLIPVVKLATADGSGAIRVIYRSNDGESIGDIVTRTVQNGQKLEIAATAGFDDIGMHAAYRTGETKPWTVEVYEAPTASAANEDFKKLFQMNVSTDRR
ncbi:MAG: hypothetical protein ABIT37_16125 [Luteolibacter sp.]